MQPFTEVSGCAVVWLKDDVTIDSITPMRRILLHGDRIDDYAFESFRFLDGDAEKGILNPDFPLNQNKNIGAPFLITGENFGCGAAREPAATVIAHMGIRCLIGVSFGTTFVKSCYQQCILPIAFDRDTVLHLADLAEAGGVFTADLVKKVLHCPDGLDLMIEVDESKRLSMMEGLDDVGMTLKEKDVILAFFEEDKKKRPWLYSD